MVVVIVSLTVIIFILVEGILRLATRKVPAPKKEDVKALETELDQVPSGVFIHPGHTWAQILPSGRVRIGADVFAQRAVGRIDRVRTRPNGETVRQGDPLLSLEQGDRQIVLPAPVSGTVEYANLEASSQRWVCTLRPQCLAEELGALKVAEQARSWLQNEVHRLKAWLDTLAISGPNAALQDGGMLVEGFMEHLDEAAWRDFQAQFFNATVETTIRDDKEQKK